jgi:hypothetical protein
MGRHQRVAPPLGLLPVRHRLAPLGSVVMPMRTITHHEKWASSGPRLLNDMTGRTTLLCGVDKWVP